MSSNVRRNGSSGLSYTLPMNARTAIICAVCVIAVVCVFYSWSRTSTGSSSTTRLNYFKSWKAHELVDIPSNLLDKTKSVKIDERTLNFDVNQNKVSIYFKEVRQRVSGHGRSALLLHGAGSSSQIWQDIGSIELLAAMGYRVIAIDLPGWAKSKATPLPAELHGPFIERFLQQEKLVRPVIITASMSGQYSIPYLMEPQPISCHNRARALITVAPTYTETYTPAQYHRCEIPVMIVFGTKDKGLGLMANGNLRNMPNSEIFEMKGAGHACNEERPDEFNKLLYNFLRAIDQDSS